MADDTIDLLKIKIEAAKRELPLETINAISAVDWRAAILGLREKFGYTFEQLGDLELETELLLCGLVNPADYPKELQNRMGVSRTQADELINELNNLVFAKIREELIKNTERKNIFANKTEEIKEEKNDTAILSGAGIEIIEPKKEPLLEIMPPHQNKEEKKEEQIPPRIPAKIGGEVREVHPILQAELNRIETAVKLETPVIAKAINPMLAQKLSSSMQMPIMKTEHSLDNITKASGANPAIVKSKIPNVDPYREMPE